MYLEDLDPRELTRFFTEYEQRSKDATLIVKKQEENTLKYFKSLFSQIGVQTDIFFQAARDYGELLPTLVQGSLPIVIY